MDKTMRKFLHDTVAEILGLDGNRVIWRNQDAPKMPNPIVALFVYSLEGQAMPNYRPSKDAGKALIYVPTDAVLEVQMFDKRGEFPVDKLETLVRTLEAPDYVDLCSQNGVAFFDSEPIQDVTTLLENGQQYEPRAAVDLHFRYTAVTTAHVGEIRTVNVNGKTDERALDFSVSVETQD